MGPGRFPRIFYSIWVDAGRHSLRVIDMDLENHLFVEDIQGVIQYHCPLPRRFQEV